MHDAFLEPSHKLPVQMMSRRGLAAVQLDVRPSSDEAGSHSRHGSMLAWRQGGSASFGCESFSEEVVQCCWDLARYEMRNEFFKQLPKRVQDSRPDTAQKGYALYVRLARLRLKMDRAELAQRTGLKRRFLAILENGLLLSDELTEKERGKIEQTLGVSYETFRHLNGAIMAELQQDWDCADSSSNEVLKTAR